MRVIVLGAGVVGVASAWYLAAAGHEVRVIDRQPAAGMETSFANGGQISVSHAEPWANPTAPLKILQWLGREDAPLLFRPRADPAQWRWALRFLVECLPWRARFNTGQAFALALHSRAQLQRLRADTGIEYLQNTRGILHIYTEPRLFGHAGTEAALLRARGFDAALKTPQECLAIEPALAHSRVRLYGGIYTASDESGDAFSFTQALAGMAAKRGVEFKWNTAVRRLTLAGGSVSAVEVLTQGAEETLKADAYVMALGSYSPLLLSPLGVTVPVYPVKGYSITVPLGVGDVAPQISLTDHERKLVFSRLGNRLRVAGTAELNGYNTDISDARCEALIRRTQELFPGAGNAAGAQRWAGLRPATPSNLPCIGRSRIPNLWLNTGHGTLGWTMACGSGHAIAELVSGREPGGGFDFLRGG
jgi:D-amino-acid dehydrogenase